MDIIEKNLIRLPRKTVAPDLSSRIQQRIREEKISVSSAAISVMDRIQNRQWSRKQEVEPDQEKRPLLQNCFDPHMICQTTKLPRRVVSGAAQNILWATREQPIAIYERGN